MRFEFKLELVEAKLEDTDSFRVINLKKKKQFYNFNWLKQINRTFKSDYVFSSSQNLQPFLLNFDAT